MQVPSLRPVFGELFFTAEPSRREPGGEMSGGIEPTLTPFLQPNQFTSTNRTIQLKTAAGGFARNGEGDSLKQPQIVSLMPFY